MHERFYRFADEGRAAEPAADQHLETGFALCIPVQAKADVMHLDCRAIVFRCGDGEFELARQEGEFRVQRRILPQQLGPDTGIFDLAGRHTGPLIRRDVACVVA